MNHARWQGFTGSYCMHQEMSQTFRGSLIVANRGQMISFHSSLSFHKFCFLDNFPVLLCNNLSGDLGYSSISKYPRLFIVDTYTLRTIFNVQIRFCVHVFIFYELKKAYFSCRHSIDTTSFLALRYTLRKGILSFRVENQAKNLNPPCCH